MTSRSNTARNPITGDKLQTKPTTEAYRDNWDRIFGRREEKCPDHNKESEKENDREIQESK